MGGAVDLVSGLRYPVAMGVEYRNFLLPRDRAFVPTAERISRLVERMRAERWILTPASDHGAAGGWAEPFIEKATSPRQRRVEVQPVPIPVGAEWLAGRRDPCGANAQADELALHFEVSAPDEGFSDLDLPYPLAYGEDEPGYHDILVYASRDFVWHLGYGDVACACGAPLAYTVGRGTIAPIDLEERIRSMCPACTAPFGGDLGDAEGIAFRFAVVVDCGKGWPLVGRAGAGLSPVAALDGPVLRSAYGDPAPPIRRAFSTMVEESVGAPFESVPDFY